MSVVYVCMYVSVSTTAIICFVYENNFVTPAEVTPLICALPTLLPTPPRLKRLSAEPVVISSNFIIVAEVSTVDTAVGAILPY